MKTYPDSSFNEGWRQIWPTSPSWAPCWVRWLLLLLHSQHPSLLQQGLLWTGKRLSHSFSLRLCESLLHLGSPWGFSVDVCLSLTSPWFMRVMKPQAPGGKAAGALGRPFRVLLFLQSVTCCLQLGVVHYNLMKSIFLGKTNLGPCQSN